MRYASIFLAFVRDTPAPSSVDKGNLVLGHIATHFLLNSGGIGCWVAELNVVLCLDTRANRIQNLLCPSATTGLNISLIYNPFRLWTYKLQAWCQRSTKPNMESVVFLRKPRVEIWSALCSRDLRSHRTQRLERRRDMLQFLSMDKITLYRRRGMKS